MKENKAWKTKQEPIRKLCEESTKEGNAIAELSKHRTDLETCMVECQDQETERIQELEMIFSLRT